MNYTDAALRYHEAGMKVIPFRNKEDGGKSFPPDYAGYRNVQTVEDIQKLFARDSDGIALLCTDGIEVVDIDTKHDPRGTILSDFMAAIDDFGFNEPCVVQATKSGGAHIIYRAPQTEGNLKLARRNGEKEAVLETRGAGGILFVYPTPGYAVTSGSIFDIPAIKQESRDLLISLCRHFDESKPDAIEPMLQHPRVDSSAKRPLDSYNETCSVLELAKYAGWNVIAQRGDYVRLNRPGAKNSRGVDASVNLSKNTFYPFTSSSEFDPNKNYSPAAFYAITRHGGDFKAAASALYASGYGDRVSQSTPVPGESAAPQQTAAKADVTDLISAAKSSRFQFGERPAEPPPMLVMHAQKDFKIGGRGMIGVFTGHEKSGKSYVMSCIASSALKGYEILNFKLNLDGGSMLWFDMEQSGFFFHKTQERIYKYAGLAQQTQIYDAYHLRAMTPDQRLKVVEHYVYNTPGLSCIFIDGFVDLITDYNNLELVQQLVNRLLKWSDEKNILIMGVVHVNKGDGKIRGHIGSELKNKCDFVINTAKNEGGYFTITNPTSRYVGFPDMDFTREEETGNPKYRSFTEEIFGKPTLTQFPATSPAIPPQPDFTAARPKSTDDIPF